MLLHVSRVPIVDPRTLRASAAIVTITAEVVTITADVVILS
jgi:hypothetical protein